jgi:hypothetical protein
MAAGLPQGRMRQFGQLIAPGRIPALGKLAFPLTA